MLPLGVFDEFNFCILQVLDGNLFKDFQITIKTAAILQEVQAVKRFSLYKLEQRLMSLPIEFSSPLKRDSKAEQTVCSLAEISSSGRVDNVFVGHSVRGFVKNSGPSKHFFISLELARIPREAR